MIWSVHDLGRAGGGALVPSDQIEARIGGLPPLTVLFGPPEE
jgi:hypothetical protein